MGDGIGDAESKKSGEKVNKETQVII